MDLATVQYKEKIVEMRVLREMNRHGVEAMRSKIGMKSNISSETFQGTFHISPAMEISTYQTSSPAVWGECLLYH